MLAAMPHVAETFMFTVGNSELEYSTISTHLFTVPFNISLFKIYFTFLRHREATLNVHGVYEG